MSADPGAFQIAKEIGLDGIMVNLGSEKNNLHLRKPEVQAQYLEMSRHSGIRISSIAIGELNNVPYKSDPRTEEWVWDSVTVAKNLHVPVVLLAFFNKNDLRNDPAGQEGVIRRLKTVAPHAEKNGIILGLETYLDANGHKEIIDKVGSSAVKVYFDFRNTADAGYNPVQEFTRLGKDLICELHMKENGHMLGQGTLDWEAVAAEIYRSGFFGDGWMQIEWARPDTADLVESYKKNLDYLRTLFADKI
jgi:sugar phosphate isomerase/epimerase